METGLNLEMGKINRTVIKRHLESSLSSIHNTVVLHLFWPK